MKSDNEKKIDAIAEQWVNLVLAHVRAKRLGSKKQINVNKKHKYAKQ